MELVSLRLILCLTYKLAFRYGIVVSDTRTPTPSRGILRFEVRSPKSMVEEGDRRKQTG